MNKSRVTWPRAMGARKSKSSQKALQAAQATWGCPTLTGSVMLWHEGLGTSYLHYPSQGLAHSGCSPRPVLACGKCSTSIGLAHIGSSSSRAWEMLGTSLVESLSPPRHSPTSVRPPVCGKCSTSTDLAHSRHSLSIEPLAQWVLSYHSARHTVDTHPAQGWAYTGSSQVLACEAYMGHSSSIGPSTPQGLADMGLAHSGCSPSTDWTCCVVF